MNEVNEPKLLSVVEAAALLGIGRSTAYDLIKTDKSFPVVKLGRRLLVPAARLDVWIAGRVAQRR